MILGIGIDSIEIERFTDWSSRNQKQLQRIFSPQEIEYCLQIPGKSAERFAVRFAAREAFFKALAHIQTKKIIPFLTLCKKIEVQKNTLGAPQLIVDWQHIKNSWLPERSYNINTLISLTHTKNTATAYVILETIK